MNGSFDNQRVATLDETGILSDESFLSDIALAAKKTGKTETEALNYARECLEEMAVHPEDRYLDRIARLARYMYTRSYEPELDLDAKQLERLKELASKRPLVFLWSHKSHLDSFVFTRAIYDSNFRPQPLVFAGINMAFAGLKTLAKRSGAIFLRRSFKRDEIYKLVFRHYVDYLVSQRVPLSWSIEGTRSRTGKLMPPRLGLLQWVIDSYQRAARDDVLFVPVSISFDQIAEMDDYVAIQKGLPKRKESLSWFIGYISGMKVRVGKIYLRFGEPIALSDSSSVTEVAFEVMSRIEHATPITTTDLVTMALLGANEIALTENQIRAHALQIIRLIESRGLPTAGDLEAESASGLEAALTLMASTGLLHCFADGNVPVYRVAPGNELAAAYYRNTIIHYFLSSAIAELAVASLRGGMESEDSLHAKALELRDLLKFEFFFKTKAEFLADTDWFLDQRYRDWNVALSSRRPAADILFKERAPLFGHSIMRSFLESYQVMARVLSNHPEYKFHNDSELIDECMRQGEEMLLRKRIDSASALSEPLFATAARLAHYRGLMAGEPDDLIAKRNQFAAEISDAVHAVRLLQDHYNQHQGQISDCA